MLKIKYTLSYGPIFLPEEYPLCSGYNTQIILFFRPFNSLNLITTRYDCNRHQSRYTPNPHCIWHVICMGDRSTVSAGEVVIILAELEHTDALVGCALLGAD